VAAVQAALDAAAQAYTAADQALKNGNLGEYQRQVEIARQRLTDAQNAMG